ncbi:hypothetical protein [Thermococcus sp.]|uniref:hypothetical protein n=1 Tax=Thermococcus sp. TaxID=35749 RepID=UPI0025D63031|nr:hypothetical protein [Thermococcus sp.]
MAMGLSVSVTFAILLTATLVSFGILYTSFENAYISLHEASTDQNAALLKMRTALLELSSYRNTTLGNVSFYDVNFTLTNAGCTLSPPKWRFVYDGTYDTFSDIVVQDIEYLLPGDSINVTVQNVPKDSTVHSLVINTGTGCSMKIKWEWVGNQTQGSAEVLGSAWYCPVEG